MQSRTDNTTPKATLLTPRGGHDFSVPFFLCGKLLLASNLAAIGRAPESDTQGALASAKGNNLLVSSLVIAVAT